MRNVVHAYSKVTLVQKDYQALTLSSLSSASFNLSEPAKPAVLRLIFPVLFFHSLWAIILNVFVS